MASFNMISLNAQQKRALEFVSGGHNLVLLGPAGTGLSFLVNRVVEICFTMGKQCAVTATTGTACSVYPAQLKPMTIYRWSGIGDGRYDSSELKRIVKNNVRYKDVMDRIFNTDVLIIDECSMFSKRLLETLHENLSDVLVNGLMGEVYDICDDGKILVEFPKMNEKIYVDRVKFEVFDPRKNKVVATREQLPLKPAYALTIHKSQGMTLERVEVDCRDIFKPGQLGVAIGRARSLDGLRVINFNKNACIKQPEKI
ncbi:uncharacterized protein LOC128554617 [Mercenaria mercenaria]|uniref:uncharacterized protein LOC128554617 n=1 Tax=Mercenaria mercenaria TaxID=6596 RepID=UPI00234F83ED|nr:uncharacterized protein LOC128554617 [Mercenaria mercenaria]